MPALLLIYAIPEHPEWRKSVPPRKDIVACQTY